MTIIDLRILTSLFVANSSLKCLISESFPFAVIVSRQPRYHILVVGVYIELRFEKLLSVAN